MDDANNARKFIVKNESVILRAVSDTTQAKVGESMGHAAGYVSNFLKGDQKVSFPEVLALLDACGLVVHRCTDDAVIVPADDWKSTLNYAKRYWADRKCL